ncbi:MAG: class I SAM-dependent methyltransferase [Acidobacteriaceae bacterium]
MPENSNEISGTVCAVCGADRWEFLREARDLCRPGYDAHFQLSECLTCGHVMQTPLPTDAELRAAYTTGYAPYRVTWKERGWPLWKILRRVTTWRRVRRLSQYGRGSRLLEVGAGAGDFLDAARRKGWDVKAVEYSDELVEAMRSDLGLDVQAGELRPEMWEDGSFDTVVLWSVIEHVPDPLATLQLICSYLRPGGQLLLQFPTLYGIQRGNWFGEHWTLLELPRHLNFFGSESLAKLCKLAGMELVVFKTPMLDALWCYYASSSSYVAHAKTLKEKCVRLLGVGAQALIILPDLIVQAWRTRGTEALAVAVKKPV